MQQQNNDFLEEIYSGAKMGLYSIDTIMKKNEDTHLRSELERQYTEFEQIESTALSELSKRSKTPKDVSTAKEVGAWIGIQTNTFTDSSPSKIAQLMIEGNNMGIVSMTKELNSNPQVDSQIKDIAHKFIQIQQNNIDKLKPFLS